MEIKFTTTYEPVNRVQACVEIEEMLTEIPTVDPDIVILREAIRKLNSLVEKVLLK